MDVTIQGTKTLFFISPLLSFSMVFAVVTGTGFLRLFQVDTGTPGAGKSTFIKLQT
jgi:hypothetical protein